MIVLNRFRVDDPATFQLQAGPALELLRGKAGVVEVDLVQNLDEPTLWALVSRWVNVGSYRRALSGYESKAVVVPFLSQSMDEPSAYADSDDVGPNLPRGHG